ncbi:hypothetical protein D3C75_975760 [compost metagenome]
MPGVFVTAVDFLKRSGGWDITLFQVIQQGLTGTQIPLTPRRDHLQVRSQCGIGGFETHLIVAFTGSPVAQRIGTHFQRQLNLSLGNDRTRH